MHLALIAAHFPPVQSSCAVQMRDLGAELVRQGHRVTFLVPDPTLDDCFALEETCGIHVLRLKAPGTSGRSYAARTIAEFLMPFAMLLNLRRSPLAGACFDGIIWYSPNIFFGPLVRALKRRSRCRAYLILRDIFPQWAADVGVIRSRTAFRLLSAIADYQYRLADVIGVQSSGNLPFCEARAACSEARIEVLQNWLAPEADAGCSIDVAATPLHGRKIFVYAGNMGVAQGMDRLLHLAAAFRHDPRFGFLFVGRGTEAARLKKAAQRERLVNTLFFDAIPPHEIPGLYAQCHVGLVALDARHRTHNIPGKFITYLHSNLPVLAAVNSGNDLVELIRRHRLGRVSVDPSGSDLPALVEQMIGDELRPSASNERYAEVGRRLFSAETAAAQVAAALVPATSNDPDHR